MCLSAFICLEAVLPIMSSKSLAKNGPFPGLLTQMLLFEKVSPGFISAMETTEAYAKLITSFSYLIGPFSPYIPDLINFDPWTSSFAA